MNSLELLNITGNTFKTVSVFNNLLTSGIRRIKMITGGGINPAIKRPGIGHFGGGDIANSSLKYISLKIFSTAFIIIMIKVILFLRTIPAIKASCTRCFRHKESKGYSLLHINILTEPLCFHLRICRKQIIQSPGT